MGSTKVLSIEMWILAIMGKKSSSAIVDVIYEVCLSLMIVTVLMLVPSPSQESHFSNLFLFYPFLRFSLSYM